MKKSSILLAFLFPVFLFSQNYKKEIMSVARYFTLLDNYSMNVHYALYVDNNFSKPFEERTLSVKRDSKNMKLNYGKAMEMIDNEKFQLIIDHEEKRVTARKKKEKDDSKETAKEMDSYMQLYSDSLLYAYDRIKLLSESKGKKVYELTFKPNEVVEKTILTINTTLKCFESVEITYKQPVKMDQLDGKYHKVTIRVNYEDFKPNCVKDTKDFSEKNYISESKSGKISVTKKYTQYKVVYVNDKV